MEVVTREKFAVGGECFFVASFLDAMLNCMGYLMKLLFFL